MVLTLNGQRDELSQGKCESGSARKNTLALFLYPEQTKVTARITGLFTMY
jgi:hypothetical protein